MKNARFSILLGLAVAAGGLFVYRAAVFPAPLMGQENAVRKQADSGIPSITLTIEGKEYRSEELKTWIEEELESLRQELKEVDSKEVRNELEEMIQEAKETQKTVIGFLKQKIGERTSPRGGERRARIELKIDDIPEVLLELLLREDEDKTGLSSEAELEDLLDEQSELFDELEEIRSDEDLSSEERKKLEQELKKELKVLEEEIATIEADNPEADNPEEEMLSDEYNPGGGGIGHDYEVRGLESGYRDDAEGAGRFAEEEKYGPPPEIHELENRIERLTRAAELLEEAGEHKQADGLMEKVQELEEELEMQEGPDMPENEFMEELLQEMRGLHEEIHELRKEVQELKELMKT